MAQFTVVGPSDDGTHIVIADATGQTHELAVTAQLREAIRSARVTSAMPPAPPTDVAPSMAPREIQRRIRAGLNAVELAELTGLAIETLRPFEGPVLAERGYVAQLARTTRIGRDATAPMLGDLVADRLASRGVDPDQLQWDAYRDEGSPWSVAVDFMVDSKRVRAEWSFDHVSRTVTATDDESRWLSETELLDVPIPRRHLTAVRAGLDPVVVPSPSTPTEELLEDLSARRGMREEIEIDDEPSGPTRTRESTVSFVPADSSTRHPAGSARRETTSQDDAVEAPSEQPATPSNGTRKPKKGRASVPSWDEIVFGAKNDS